MDLLKISERKEDYFKDCTKFWYARETVSHLFVLGKGTIHFCKSVSHTHLDIKRDYGLSILKERQSYDGFKKIKIVY